MRDSFAAELVCIDCRGGLTLEVFSRTGTGVNEGVLRCSTGHGFPIIRGIPRMLPRDLAVAVSQEQPDFFARHPELSPAPAPAARPRSLSTLRAFGDEWTRFPELLTAHERIFEWYFEGPAPMVWKDRRILDAGCGMGRWLHFACARGAQVVGLDLSPAIDVAAAREGDRADFVQADLRHLPFPRGSFDVVYSLGVVHHLEDPVAGLGALAELLRPGGQLRFYVYRSLEGEPAPRRALLWAVTQLRRLTTRLPFWGVEAMARLIAVVAAAAFLAPRRLFRRFEWGDWLTRGLPLVQYADVPFRMLVAEQFDRLVAPIEGRYSPDELTGWMRGLGLQLEALLPDLGWRAIARRP
jgi:SAM-dependent methyltransferase